jgi:hypothetical protein
VSVELGAKNNTEFKPPFSLLSTMHSASARAPASVVGGGAVGLCSSALAGCVDESRLPSIPFLAKLRGAARARASRRKGCGTLDQHKRWFNFDPCGLVCASLVYYIVLFSTYTVLTKIIWPWFGGPFDYLASFLHSALFTTFATLALVSHMRTMLSNPGAVPFNARPTSPEGWAHECRKCRNFKPERAHHCSICGRCVVKMGETEGEGEGGTVCAKSALLLLPPRIHTHTLNPPSLPLQTTTARG